MDHVVETSTVTLGFFGLHRDLASQALSSRREHPSPFARHGPGVCPLCSIEKTLA
jgi:hypothetical protein